MTEPLADRGVEQVTTLRFALKTQAARFSIAPEMIDELVIREDLLHHVLDLIARVRIPALVGTSVSVPAGWRDYLLHGLKAHPRWGGLWGRLTRHLPVHYQVYEASCMIPDLPHAQRAFETKYALFTGFQTYAHTENPGAEPE